MTANDRPIARQVFVNIKDWELGPRFKLSRARRPQAVKANSGGSRLDVVDCYSGGGNETKEACLSHLPIR